MYRCPYDHDDAYDDAYDDGYGCPCCRGYDYYDDEYGDDDDYWGRECFDCGGPLRFSYWTNSYVCDYECWLDDGSWDVHEDVGAVEHDARKSDGAYVVLTARCRKRSQKRNRSVSDRKKERIAECGKTHAAGTSNPKISMRELRKLAVPVHRRRREARRQDILEYLQDQESDVDHRKRNS